MQTPSNVHDTALRPAPPVPVFEGRGAADGVHEPFESCSSSPTSWLVAICTWPTASHTAAAHETPDTVFETLSPVFDPSGRGASSADHEPAADCWRRNGSRVGNGPLPPS